jgi:hypothetical protein
MASFGEVSGHAEHDARCNPACSGISRALVTQAVVTPNMMAAIIGLASSRPGGSASTIPAIAPAALAMIRRDRIQARRVAVRSREIHPAGEPDAAANRRNFAEIGPAENPRLPLIHLRDPKSHHRRPYGRAPHRCGHRVSGDRQKARVTDRIEANRYQGDKVEASTPIFYRDATPNRRLVQRFLNSTHIER